MASFLDKIKVKTAIDNRSKFDLGSDHITTAGWMQYNVVFNKEMVPTEKLDVKMETLVRMLPLERPTFGRANVNNRGFFVPYRTIFPAWNDFIADTVRVRVNGDISSAPGLVSRVHIIPNTNLVYLFVNNNDYAESVSSESTDTEYDFVVNNEGVYTKYKFTIKGRQVYKVLCSLGYNIIWDLDTGDGTLNLNSSALPLLAWVKIYVDWYWPSMYVNNSNFLTLDHLTKIDSTSGISLDSSTLKIIFDTIQFVCYDSDYFVSAWDNPNAPTTGNFSNITIHSIDNASGSGNDSYAAVGGSSAVKDGSAFGYIPTTGKFTQYLITALKSLTDYMKRHQLVGSRVLDRYLARFGVQLSSEKLERSVYLGSHKVPLQIGDVVSTSDTAGAGLGDYAGKGIGYNSNDFSYETEEYGQFMIISTIIPSVGYYQGLDRNVLHTNKLDFWTPEFDNLGSQPITANEVYINNDSSFSTGRLALNGQVFGFAPRYAEYKVSRDRLTGDFRCNTVNTGEDSWYLLRDLDPMYKYVSSVNQVVHNLNFMRSITDKEQYNRIFQNGIVTQLQAPDMFKVIYHFEIGSLSPMKSLYDTYEFDSNGKEVTEDVNGVKMN